jgi:hypothetical protein
MAGHTMITLTENQHGYGGVAGWAESQNQNNYAASMILAFNFS